MRACGVWPFLTTVLLLVGLSTPAGGHHGGVLHLNAERAGPYAVSAWTESDPVRVGTCVVTVAVMRPLTRVPVTDVAVRVTARRPDGSAVSAEGDAGQDPLGIRYLADVVLPVAGRWTVTVAVHGPAGAGEVDFPLEVALASSLPWWALGRAIVAAIVAIGLRASMRADGSRS
jgi:hypothetical protein